MAAKFTKPVPAYETHEDAKDPAVMCRLTGMAELGPGILSLSELKVSCKSQAEQGMDPVASGTVEVGLFLPTDDYEALKTYAASLSVNRPKRKKAKK